jgi:hypothetical protein
MKPRNSKLSKAETRATVSAAMAHDHRPAMILDGHVCNVLDAARPRPWQQRPWQGTIKQTEELRTMYAERARSTALPKAVTSAMLRLSVASNLRP